MNDRIRKLTYAALYLALALVLPFLTGQIPEIGARLSPMHIPVLLCGFVCGWQWGMAVGLIAPLLRSALFGMPSLYPTAVAMTFELAAYGALSGLLYRLLPRKVWSVYASLVLAMIGGRLVWGAARYVLAGLSGSEFPLSAFFAGAVLNAVPGIVLHIVLVPALVLVMERAGLTTD
jgi:thiamine transporter ThiT